MDDARRAFLASLPRKRLAAGALFSDAAGRVLLVEPTYKPRWEIPGGVVEADESPLAAASREIKEELGLVRLLGRLLVVDWVPPSPTRTEALVLLYDGGVLTPESIDAIRVPAEELHGCAFFELAAVTQRVAPLLGRRIAAAVEARASGAVAHLEDGNPT